MASFCFPPFSLSLFSQTAIDFYRRLVLRGESTGSRGERDVDFEVDKMGVKERMCTYTHRKVSFGLSSERHLKSAPKAQ